MRCGPGVGVRGSFVLVHREACAPCRRTAGRPAQRGPRNDWPVLGLCVVHTPCGGRLRVQRHSRCFHHHLGQYRTLQLLSMFLAVLRDVASAHLPRTRDQHECVGAHTQQSSGAWTFELHEATEVACAGTVPAGIVPVVRARERFTSQSEQWVECAREQIHVVPHDFPTSVQCIDVSRATKPRPPPPRPPLSSFPYELRSHT